MLYHMMSHLITSHHATLLLQLSLQGGHSRNDMAESAEHATSKKTIMCELYCTVLYYTIQYLTLLLWLVGFMLRYSTI